jgi:hypothetical protein
VDFLCEDLPRHGVVLVPPAAGDYDRLLADIQQRANAPGEGSPPFPERFRPRISPEERPTSAILLNRNAKPIAGLQVIWQFVTEAGGSFRHSRGMLSVNLLLLPFNRQSESLTKLYTYWYTIFPGSKRYLGESGMVGDNTDVRPPAEDEKWRGGITAGGSGGGKSREPIRQVTLILDGVFFLDGEFVGPDGLKTFEQTVADAEAHRIVARIAKSGHENGMSPSAILAAIEKVTGVAPDHPPMPSSLRNTAATQEGFRTAAMQSIAYQLAMRRSFPQANDEQAVFTIMSWNDVVLPNLRRAA